MIELQAGANTQLNDTHITLQFEWQASSIAEGNIDSSAFLLASDDKVRSDADFIFYNQAASLDGSVRLTSEPNKQTYTLQLDNVPADVQKIAFALVIHDEATFSLVQRARMEVAGVAFFAPDTQAMQEKALIMAHIYRHNGGWKVRAVGQGFNGGLAPLATGFGVDVDGDDAVSAGENVGDSAGENVKVEPALRVVDLEKKLLAKAPALVSLVKPIRVSLEKNNLLNVRARVAFVLDASWSMRRQFSNGNVQAVLERITTLAMCFDDDESLELWAFGVKFKKFDDVSIDNIKGYVEALQASGPPTSRDIIPGLGGRNNEVAVMKDVIRNFEDSTLPAYVIFISDGGVKDNKTIEKLIRDSAKLPIFWQFVGLAGEGYGVLEGLDNLTGRVVDNANFFAIDDFADVPDEVLYERLLNEFPDWLKAAKSAGIL